MPSITVALALLSSSFGAPPFDRLPDPVASMQLEGSYNRNNSNPNPSNSRPLPGYEMPVNRGMNLQNSEGPFAPNHSKRLAEIPNVRTDSPSRELVSTTDASTSPATATEAGASESGRPVWVYVLLAFLTAAAAIVAVLFIRAKGE